MGAPSINPCPWPSKQMLWGLVFLVPDTRLGKPMEGSELSFPWENLWKIIILEFVGSPTRVT